MATTTANLKLTKPAGTDNVDISVINNNMDTLDTAIKSLTDTSFTKDTALRGASYTVTLASSSYVKVLEISPEAFKANGYTAHIKFAFRTTTDNATIRHAGVAEYTWVWNNVEYIINNNLLTVDAGSGIYAMRALAPRFVTTGDVYAPKSPSYAGCTLSWRAYNTTSRKIELTILEADVPYTINTTPTAADGYSDTYQTYVEVTPGHANLNYQSNTGNNSVNGSAGAAWDTFYHDRCCAGENYTYGSIMGVATDGKLWKIRNTSKAFPLPLVGGLGHATYYTTSTYPLLRLSMRGVALSVFTLASMQTTAFTVENTWAIGDPVFLQGTLDTEGNFVSTGKVTNTMAPGYTYIKIGKVDWCNDKTNYAAQGWTVQMQYMTAYTLDSNGNITHIDGKKVCDTTYSAATTSANGLMSAADKIKLNGIQAGAAAVSVTQALTYGTKIGTITINGTGTDLYCQTDTNTYDRQTYSRQVTWKAGATILPGQLVMFGTDGLLYPICAFNGITHIPIDVGLQPGRVLVSSTPITIGDSVTGQYLYESHPNVHLGYSTDNSVTIPEMSEVFLIGSMYSNEFILKSGQWWTFKSESVGWSTTPEEGDVLISIGFSSESPTFALTPSKPIYIYTNGNLRLYTNTAESIGIETIGSESVPIYLENGIPTAGNYTLGATEPGLASDVIMTQEGVSRAGMCECLILRCSGEWGGVSGGWYRHQMDNIGWHWFDNYGNLSPAFRNSTTYNGDTNSGIVINRPGLYLCWARAYAGPWNTNSQRIGILLQTSEGPQIALSMQPLTANDCTVCAVGIIYVGTVGTKIYATVFSDQPITWNKGGAWQDFNCIGVARLMSTY